MKAQLRRKFDARFCALEGCTKPPAEGRPWCGEHGPKPITEAEWAKAFPKGEA